MNDVQHGPRGKCPRCGKMIALLKTGKLRRHTGQEYGRNCYGSRTNPVPGSVRQPRTMKGSENS